MRVRTLGLRLDLHGIYEGIYDNGGGAESATKTLQRLSSCRSNTAPPLRVLCLPGLLNRDATLNALLPCMQDLRVS